MSPAAKPSAPGKSLKWMPKYATVSELVKAVDEGEEDVGLVGRVNPSEAEVEAIALAMGASCKVKRMELTSNVITDGGASALASAVARSTSLTELVLANAKITDGGASALASAVARSTSLTELNLFHNQITDVGASALASAVARSTSLVKVDLGLSLITDVGAFALAKGLARSSSTLEFLTCSGRLTARGISALDSARAAVKATRPTLWILTGAPTSRVSPAILWRGFMLEKDGDHAMWVRVMDFLWGSF